MIEHSDSVGLFIHGYVYCTKFPLTSDENLDEDYDYSLWNFFTIRYLYTVLLVRAAGN